MPALVTPLHSGRFPFPIDFSLVRTIGIFFSFHNRLHSRSWLTASHRNHVNLTMFPKQFTVLSVKLLAMLYHKVVATKLQHPENSDSAGAEDRDKVEIRHLQPCLCQQPLYLARHRQGKRAIARRTQPGEIVPSLSVIFIRASLSYHPRGSRRRATGWYETEGFDTLDLQEARALLKKLAPES